MKERRLSNRYFPEFLRHFIYVMLISTMLLLFSNNAIATTVDPINDLKITKIDKYKYTSKHFVLTVKFTQPRATAKQNTEDWLALIYNSKRSKEGQQLLSKKFDGKVSFPAGVYQGADTVKFASNNIVPKVIQWKLSSLELAYELAKEDGFVNPDEPGGKYHKKKIPAQVYKTGGGAAVSSVIWLGSGLDSTSLMLHEYQHMVQINSVYKHIPWPLTESGAQHVAMKADIASSVIDFLIKDDISVLYRDKFWDDSDPRGRMGHYVLYPYYDYLFQRMYSMRHNRYPGPADVNRFVTQLQKVHNYHRYLYEYLTSSWIIHTYAYGKDATDRTGRNMLEALKSIITSYIDPKMSNKEAEKVLVQWTHDYWEQILLSGVLADNGNNQDNLQGIRDYWTHKPGQDPTDCLYDGWVNRSVVGNTYENRNYLSPLCWLEWANTSRYKKRWNPCKRDIPECRNRIQKRKIIPLSLASNSRGKVTNKVELRTTGEGRVDDRSKNAKDWFYWQPVEHKGVNPFNARYVVIDTSRLDGSLELKIDSLLGKKVVQTMRGKDGSAVHITSTFQRPLARVYRLVNDSGSKLGKKWEYVTKLKDNKPYQLMTNNNEQIIVLVTTGNFYSSSEVSATFTPLNAVTNPIISWLPANSKGQNAIHVKESYAGAPMTILLGEIWRPPTNDGRHIYQFSLKIDQKHSPASWQFLNELTNAKVFLDKDNNGVFNANDELYFNGMPRVVGNTLIFWLNTRPDHPIPVNADFLRPNARVLVKVTVNGGPLPKSSTALTVRLDENQTVSADMSGHTLISVLTRHNSENKILFHGPCNDNTLYVDRLLWEIDPRLVGIAKRQIAYKLDSVSSLACFISSHAKLIDDVNINIFHEDSLTPEFIERFEQTTQDQMARQAELLTLYRKRDALDTLLSTDDSFIPIDAEGNIIVPQIRTEAHDNGTFTAYIEYFDEIAASEACNYENTNQERATPIDMAATIHTHLCPTASRFYSFDTTEGGNLFVRSDFEISILSETGQILGYSQNGSLDLRIPSDVGILYAQINATDLTDINEGDLSIIVNPDDHEYIFTTGSHQNDSLSDALLTDINEDDLSIIVNPDDHEHIFTAGSHQNDSLSDALLVEESIVGANLDPSTPAYHEFRGPIGNYNMLATDGLQIEVYDQELLLIQADVASKKNPISVYKAKEGSMFIVIVPKSEFLHLEGQESPFSYDLAVVPSGHPSPFCQPESLQSALHLKPGQSFNGTLCGPEEIDQIALSAGESGLSISLSASPNTVANCEGENGSLILYGEYESSGVLTKGDYVCNIQSGDIDTEYSLQASSLTPYLYCPATLDLGKESSFSITASNSQVGNHLVGPCGGQGYDVSFTWTPHTSGTYEINTFGSDIDTVLYVLKGNCKGEVVACNDDYNDLQSSLSTYLEEEETVVIVADSYNSSDQGNIVLEVKPK